NLNIDMIGRIDDFHKSDPEYIYLIGSNRLSADLDSVVNQQNRKHTNLKLDYRYNDENDPLRLYYRSDHYNFARHNIPVIFFFSGLHEDYHKTTDTADKIDYELLTHRTKLIFYTLWKIANRDEKIKLDETS
ncbi:MAG TPA: M28 family peptidase, partial [Flavobacteriaceae bacterium]|nr:M28 family peptidase [Flavobacteriaceae bacterium]